MQDIAFSMELRLVLLAILFGVVVCELPPMTSEQDALAYLASVEEGKETLDSMLIKNVRHDERDNDV